MQSPLPFWARGSCSQNHLCTCQPLGRTCAANCLSLEVRRHMCSKIGWKDSSTISNGCLLRPHYVNVLENTEERVFIGIKVIPESARYQEGNTQEFMVAVSHGWVRSVTPERWPKRYGLCMQQQEAPPHGLEQSTRGGCHQGQKRGQGQKSAQVLPQGAGN